MYCTVGCCLQLLLVNGFFVGSRRILCVPHKSSCIKQSPQIMSTPGDRTHKPNMEGQKTVATMVAQPCLEDKKVKDDPVIAPVVSGLSVIGLEPGTEENPDMASVVVPVFASHPHQTDEPQAFHVDDCKATFSVKHERIKGG
jgi:hypothetical protein